VSGDLCSADNTVTMPPNQAAPDRTVPTIKIKNNQIVKNNKMNSTNEYKRSLSTTSSPPQSPPAVNIKKSKLFVTSNRFSILTTEQSTIDNDNDNDNITDPTETSNTTNHTPKTILPPPIFIKGVLDFIGLRNDIKDIIGPNSFSCKSNSTHLKIQTDTPDHYRKLIHYLKNINAQYHTYQLQSDKSLRIVVRNLHPTSSKTDIAHAIEEIGHTVRNVTNVKHHQTKIPLPLFFIDIDPKESDSDIFAITSLLHTKVKIEEPFKKSQIPQCQNCQSYGHTRTYCAHLPMCVKCGEGHHSSTCLKSKDLPAKCALCQGAHPANYKGCTIYKQLSRKQNNISNKSSQQPPLPNFSRNPEHHQQHPANGNPTSPRSYANVTEGHQLPNFNTTPTNNNEISFFKFIDEFKSIINPLISLLTTVLSRLIKTNNVN